MFIIVVRYFKHLKSKHQHRHQQSDQLIDIQLEEYTNAPHNNNLPSIQPLGIHVIPTFDSHSQYEMGLIIQRIEPNARIANDGRMRVGDRLVEINNLKLTGVDFIRAQEILRETIAYSNQHLNGKLNFKCIRWYSKNLDTDRDDEDTEICNERPIEADQETEDYHDEHELQ